MERLIIPELDREMDKLAALAPQIARILGYDQVNYHEKKIVFVNEKKNLKIEITWK